MSKRKPKKIDLQPVTRIHLVPRSDREAYIAEMVSKNYFLWYEDDLKSHVRLVFMLVS